MPLQARSKAAPLGPQKTATPSDGVQQAEGDACASFLQEARKAVLREKAEALRTQGAAAGTQVRLAGAAATSLGSGRRSTCLPPPA